VPADGSSSRQAAGIPAVRPGFASPSRIEFACPHCGNLVGTPAGAAGKKGRCPSCREIVDIPHAGAH